MTAKALSLSEIRIDGGTQPRAEISVTTVRGYAELLSAHIVLPPPDVFFDGVTYWLADGFHRFFAAKQIERTAITCTVHSGTKRDAVLFSVSANHSHGLQRTNEDKRKAVMTLLRDEEWSTWSNAEISRRCGVDSSTVDKWRVRSLPESGSEKPSEPTYTTKHGTTATMQVGKIGRAGKAPRTKTEKASRHEQLREWAAAGHTTPQIAAQLGISESGLRDMLKRNAIEVPADRVTGKYRRHDANRIVESMVMDAENITADVNLIEFSTLDRERLGAWVDSLMASRKSLDTFIRRLIKEQRKHGEAA